MKRAIVAAVAGLALSTTATPAFAKGCLKGAAVGAVGGHFLGHHAVLGAAAGCWYGHHRAKVADRQAAERVRQQQAQAAAR